MKIPSEAKVQHDNRARHSEREKEGGKKMQQQHSIDSVYRNSHN